MELRHLRYFVAVAEELNFRKASERLRVAQPALSSQIQDLEAELEVKLLDRNTGGVRLTAAGSAFLTETRTTLLQAEKAIRSAREAAAGIRGRIVIGYIGSLAMDFMPATLSLYRKRFPEVDVQLIETRSFAEQMAGLESGKIDVVFAVRPDEPVPGQYKHLVIDESVGQIAMSRDHPLAKKSSVSIAELAGETVVTFGGGNSDSPHPAIVKRIFASAGVKPKATRMVDGIGALHTTVASGMGVTFLVDLVGVARRDDLVMKRIKDPKARVTVQLRVLWRAHPESVAVRNFIGVLAKVRKISFPAT